MHRLAKQDLKREFLHPETLFGEVFLTNSDTNEFESLPLRTKRRGNQAYDGEGSRLFTWDWFPVFLQKAELLNLNISLSELRSKLRTNRLSC
jgi:hypothetical protein